MSESERVEKLRQWVSARESSALVQAEVADPGGTLRWIAAGRAEAYREVLTALDSEEIHGD